MRYKFKRHESGIVKVIISNIKRRIFRNGTIIIVKTELHYAPVEKSNIEINIGELTSNDIDKIYGLGALSKSAANEYFQAGSKCVGAFLDNQLVGIEWAHYTNRYFPFFKYEYVLFDGAYTGPVFVAPKFRGCRIQMALAGALHNALVNEGYEYCYSSVWKDNKKSIGNVKRLGFNPVLVINVIRLLNMIVYKRIRAVTSWELI